MNLITSTTTTLHCSTYIFYEPVVVALSSQVKYTIVSFAPLFWCPCMAVNVSVQYNDGFLPNIILLTLCY